MADDEPGGFGSRSKKEYRIITVFRSGSGSVRFFDSLEEYEDEVALLSSLARLSPRGLWRDESPGSGVHSFGSALCE